MIMDLVYWLKQNAWLFRKKTSTEIEQNRDAVNHQKEGDFQPYVAVLHIDHMRSRVCYIKTLVSWATELSLNGRLLFLHHLILVLLFGTEYSVKDFLLRLRTQKVDVDSNGRSCKERMMTVLMQGSHPTQSDETRMSDFQVIECSTSSELKSIFTGADLMDVYKEEVLSKFTLLQPTSKSGGKS